jgi:hypothetical protein
VDYLGSLDEAELRDEATTWNTFLHPIFCNARGCSTKLAIAMAWHIPIVTTSIGHRGYRWTRGSLVLAETPAAFASRCLELLEPARAEEARHQVSLIAGSSPSLSEVAGAMRELLGLSSPTESRVMEVVDS